MEKEASLSLLLRKILLGVLTGALLFLLFRLFFDLLLPFTTAFVTALLLSPLSKRLGKKTKMPMRTLRLLLLFLLMGTLAFLLTLGAIRLFKEAKDFFLSFYDSFDALASSFFSWMQKLENKIPSADASVTEKFADVLKSSVQNAMAELSSRSAAFAAKAASKLPATLFALLIFVLALFYCFVDYDRITAYLASLIPPRFRSGAERLRSSFFSAVKRFGKAYSLLFLITFAELFFAFVFLRVNYAALLALTAAALDILPAVGVGLLLIPWSITLFITGNTKRAIAVLVIYLVVTLLRQIWEPHIVGAHFGLHPLASLISLYAGFRLLGILGVLLSPFLALVFSHVLTLYRKKIATSCEDASQHAPPNEER